MLQKIIVWKEFKFGTCFIYFLLVECMDLFLKCVVEINVLFKCEILII